MFIESKFVGGIDVISELISEGEFEDMIPDKCKPLSPKDALKEFMSEHKIVCFTTNQHQDIPEQLKSHSFVTVNVDQAPQEWR